MSSSDEKSHHAYHHGDLRQALLKQARASLTDTGVDKLSLRAVAAQVGVSHAATYYHFANKTALLNALALDAFADLQQYMAAVLETEPEQQLRGLARAYVDFALTHPAEFRLMFAPALRRDDERTPVEQAGRATYQQLLDAVQALQNITAPTEATAITLWALVHGLATLMLDGPLYRNARTTAGRQKVLEIAIDQLLNGVLSTSAAANQASA